MKSRTPRATVVKSRLASTGSRLMVMRSRGEGIVKFETTFVSRKHWFSIGKEIDSGKCFLSISVSNRRVDYDEYYEISEQDAKRFVDDVELGDDFAEKCRKRMMDDLLIVKPGSDRGSAI